MGNCIPEQGVNLCKELYQDKNILDFPIMRSEDGNICQSFKINNPNSGVTERDRYSHTE
jgi:hypothetical protein